MIFESYLQPIAENMNMNLNAYNDIQGSPFEYMIGAAYECAFMQNQINLMAMCEEYNYLRENGTVEPIHEANIVVKIFSAIKNAIATVFRKICEFFKSIFSRSNSTSDDIKKKNNIINNNKSKKIEHFELSYIEVDDLDEIANSLGDIPYDIADEAAPAIANVFQMLTKEIVDMTPDQRREELKVLNSKEYKQLDEFVKYAADDHITEILKMYATNCPSDVLDIIEKMEKGEGITLKDLPYHIVDISDPNTVADAASQINKSIGNLGKIRDSLNKAFNVAKKVISMAKDAVNKAEIASNRVLNTLAQERNDKTLSDATKLISETAKYANITLNFIDKWLVKFENVLAKLIIEQMNQYNRAVTALAGVAVPALPGPTA